MIDFKQNIFYIEDCNYNDYYFKIQGDKIKKLGTYNCDCPKIYGNLVYPQHKCYTITNNILTISSIDHKEELKMKLNLENWEEVDDVNIFRDWLVVSTNRSCARLYNLINGKCYKLKFFIINIVDDLFIDSRCVLLNFKDFISNIPCDQSK